GAGVGQPWRDLRKLLRKQQIRPAGTTVLFVVAPAVVAGSALLVAAALPLVTTASPLDPAADLFAVVGVLLIGTVALALAGLDTGTAFGGMGASRGMTVAALVEPTLLMAMFALSVPAGSTNLGAIVSAGAADPWRAISPSAVLALAALMVAILAEAGRLPVDNPATHLELTMIHEAMVLEYAGPRLAIMEWAGGMRLTVLLALLANLLLPFGVAGAAAGIGAVLLAAGLIAVKVTVLAAALAAVEVFVAKLRLFRVPELLAGSFVLALLAVTAAFFLTGSGV
ncbi:MAG TPA: NADH-quinone oxidoreductase subunit H, partial [Nakamurella sp.]|nr:NADH-quinone oxidoreductase subunit H [Nakamurella sp.]